MFYRTWATTVILSATMTAAAVASALAPSALSMHPEHYDGSTVTVTGKVMHFEASSSPQVTAYQLCDARCIIVIDKTNAVHHNGSTVTVTGVFHAKWRGAQRSFSNTVVVG